MHKLATPWTFYYYQKPSSEETNYEDSIHKISKFSTCEEFWAIYSYLIRPKKLNSSLALHLFRNDSRAMWEDEENRNGGSFLLRFPKGQAINIVWEKLVLSLIGEQFPSDVNGIVVSTRSKYDLIHIWHKTTSDEAVKMEICSTIWRVLDLATNAQIDYSPFQTILNNHKICPTKYTYDKREKRFVVVPFSSNPSPTNAS
ncbi:Eukaryotic initiation factor 4E family protein [Histomonas meleagridis]|uniref:Eukaryotic initiation factor 4E family protein n=1 Tax=Histomonas meleagridis TaxID=135588 RepID=UPI0035597FEE|nr:Eukaryotic initiation factor 4E family protein [Histomonas meleagridis]KAH0802644.1 Eukaryotic initiation factor 4E family protein [Histomonas meleagridis]